MTTLEKIKADVNREYKWLVNTKYTIHDVDIAFGHIMSCIDKYAEQEPMREFTEEEAKAYSKALDKMYKPTGFNVFNEPCEDAVSRQAVLDGIDTYINKAQSTGIIDNFISFAELVVKALPPVRPQEQTGKWEEIVKEHKCYARDDTYTTTEYHCSECGAEPFENEDGFYELSNYCPDCGAKMVAPRESEDKE